MILFPWGTLSVSGNLAEIVLNGEVVGAAPAVPGARSTEQRLADRRHPRNSLGHRGIGLGERRIASLVGRNHLLVRGHLLGGAVVVETVFAWPGIGLLAVQGVLGRDYPIVQAVIIISALIFVGINLLIDLLYTCLDPRISLRRQ